MMVKQETLEKLETQSLKGGKYFIKFAPTTLLLTFLATTKKNELLLRENKHS